MQIHFPAMWLVIPSNIYCNIGRYRILRLCILHYAMYSRANRNHFGRLLSFEDQGQHINRDAATKVFKKLHIRNGINLGDR